MWPLYYFYISLDNPCTSFLIEYLKHRNCVLITYSVNVIIPVQPALNNVEIRLILLCSSFHNYGHSFPCSSIQNEIGLLHFSLQCFNFSASFCALYSLFMKFKALQSLRYIYTYNGLMLWRQPIATSHNLQSWLHKIIASHKTDYSLSPLCASNYSSYF